MYKRQVLIGVQENDGEEVESSLEELGELARTAGALAVSYTHLRDSPRSSVYRELRRDVCF